MRLQSLPLFLLFCTLFSAPAFGQRTEEEARDDLKYDSEEPRRQRPAGFRDQLWLGTGAQLGFGATSFSSQFVVGLSPIVGYKLNNFLSVGPRAGITYNRYRDDRFNFKQGFVEYEVGAFVRAMVFRGFFAHAEYDLLNEVDIVAGQNGAMTQRRTRAVPFLGGGINQGGGPGSTGFEFLILFRLTQPDIINDSPFQIRTGINWNLF